MAEFVMREMIHERGLDDSIAVESAALHTDEIGNDTYPGTKRQLEKHGIPFSRRHAWLIQPSDYDKYDYIVGMDSYNYSDMMRRFNGDPESKCSLLMDWCGEHRDVADPWYTRDFDQTYSDVVAGCEAMLESIVYQ